GIIVSILIRKEQLAINRRQVTLDGWLIEQFRDKLTNASLLSRKKNRPILLYRNTAEESESAAEEEVATINEKYVIVQVLTHGGFIPPSFQQQYVFSLDDFAEWIIKRSRELYLQCIDNIDEQVR
ncbi:MAG: hypothetical protein WBQ25_23190, partial [Nitrososphaeraceae archaeon]